MTKKNEKRIKISNKVGSEASNEETSYLIPGIELSVLKGLRILTTLIDDMFFVAKKTPNQPIITTKKVQNVPEISEIGVWSNDESHCYDFEKHF